MDDVLKQVDLDYLHRNKPNYREAKLLEADIVLAGCDYEFTWDPLRKCWRAFNLKEGLQGEFASLDLALGWLFGELTLNGLTTLVMYNEDYRHLLLLEETDWNAERVSGIDTLNGDIRQIGYDEILAVRVL